MPDEILAVAEVKMVNSHRLGEPRAVRVVLWPPVTALSLVPVMCPATGADLLCIAKMSCKAQHNLVVKK